MLRSKKNPGKFKERVVFKFQFHLTRVPQTGWDKLKVSLIPLGGKARNKTEKAAVQYGSCRWPDPIVETTKLYLDVKLGQYDDKFYKLVVSARSRVLGEVTINLAEYLNATPSNSIVLPLKNCASDTLLHAKICSLTSLRNSINTQEREDRSSDSGENSDHSVASTTSALSGPQQTPRSTQTIQRAWDTMSTSSRFTEGGGIPASPARSTAAYERRRHRFTDQQLLRSASSGVIGTTTISGSSDNLELPRHLRSKSNAGTVERDVIGTDKAAEELRMEAVTWQRRARHLGLEVQRLNELVQQKAGGGGLANDTQRDNLKLELQSAKKAHEETEMNMRKQVEALQRSNRDLEAQVASDRESANMQLRKAQDSNTHLVLAIQDLEDSLEEQRKELEELSVSNSQLEKDLMTAKFREQDLEKQWSAKFQAMQAMVENLHLPEKEGMNNAKFQELEKFWTDKVHDLEETISYLQGKENNNMEDLQRELKELTDENVELLFKLNKVNKELESKNGYSSSREDTPRLKRVIEDLEKKLSSSEKFHQAQHESNDKLMDRLQTLIQGLRSGHADLENQLTRADGEINQLKNELARVNEEHTRDKETATEHEQERERLIVEIDGLKDESKKLVEKHESETSELLSKLGSKLSCISDLKANVLQLEMLNSGLDMKIQDSQEMDKASKSRIAELEMRLSDIERDNENLKAQLQGSEARLDSKRNELIKLDQQLEQSILAREKLERNLSNLSASKQELDVQVRGETMALRETITKLEAEVKFFVLELEACRQKKASAEGQVLKSDKERATMEAALHEYKSKWLDLDSKVSVLETNEKVQRQALIDLVTERELLTAEVDRYRSSNEVLGKEIKETDKSLADLRRDYENVKNSLELELESSKLEIGVAGDRIVELEKQRDFLEGTIREYKVSCSGLKSDRENLQSQVGRLEDEIEGIESRTNEMKDEHANAVDNLERRISGLLEEKVQFINDTTKLEEELGTFMEEAERIATKLETDKQALVDEWTAKCLKIQEMYEQANGELEFQVEELRKQVVYHENSMENYVRETADEKTILETKVGSLMTELHSAEIQVANLESQAKELQHALADSASSYKDMEGKLQREGEELARQMELQVAIMVNEKVQLEEKVSRLETEAGILKEDLDRMEFQRDEAESQVLELDNDKSILETALEECKSVCLVLSKEFETQKEAAETYKNEKEILEDRSTELGDFISNMQKCSKNVEQEYAASVAKAEEERQVLQSKIRILEGALAEQCDETETIIMKLEEKFAQWQANLEDLRVKNEKMTEILQTKQEYFSEETSRFENDITSLKQQKLLVDDELKALKQCASDVFKEKKIRLQLVQDELIPQLDTSADADILEIVNQIEVIGKDFHRTDEEIDLQEGLRLSATITNLEAQLMKNVHQHYLNKIDYFEAAIESLTASQTESALEQFQDELTRLQNQLSASSQRERELMLRLNTHQLLETEVLRLQQVNEEAENKLNKMRQASTWNDKDERLVRLEMELNEAVEANAIYKSQLQRAFGKQQQGEEQQDGWDAYRKRSFDLETELEEMHKRYSGLSLKFAEVVAEKEELGRTLKSLQKSYEFQRKNF